MRRLCLLLFFLLFALIGQTQDITLLAKPYGDKIKIKAIPTSDRAWEAWKRNGLNIEQRSANSGANFISLTPQPLKTATNDEWNQLAQQVPAAAAAIEVLHRGEVNAMPVSLEERVEANQKMRYSSGFYMLITTLAPEVSALSGFQLEIPKTSGTFEYRISIPGTEIDTIIALNHNKLYSPNTLPELHGLGSDHRALFYWDHSGFFRDIANYSIDKSADGKQWIKVNKAPIFYGKATHKKASEYDYLIQYSDSLEQNYRQQQYRLRARDYFGDPIGPGTAIDVMGTDQTAPNAPTGLKCRAVAGKALIEWQMTGDEGDLAGFFVVASKNGIQGPYEKIHADLLPANTRVFVDTSNFVQSGTYYTVLATDTARNLATSSPLLLLADDTIPPEPVTNLKANIDSLGNVLLQWDHSVSNDVKGYKVFRSDFKHHEFIKVSKEPISVNAFRDKLNLRNLDREVNYTIVTIDKSYNNSLRSDTLTLMRPDTIPPTAPMLVDLKTDSGRIQLKWRPSESRDLDHYLLESNTGPGWKPVTIIPPGLSAFAVPGEIPGSLTRYRLLAVDQNALISDAENELVYQPIKAAPRVSETTIHAEYDSDKREIKLSWSAMSLDPQANILIYRAKKEGKLRLYRSVASDQTAFTDKLIEANTRYRYALKIMTANGDKSSLTAETAVKVGK